MIACSVQSEICLHLNSSNHPCLKLDDDDEGEHDDDFEKDELSI